MLDKEQVRYVSLPSLEPGFVGGEGGCKQSSAMVRLTRKQALG